jgi:hypothetical protein
MVLLAVADGGRSLASTTLRAGCPGKFAEVCCSSFRQAMKSSNQLRNSERLSSTLHQQASMRQLLPAVSADGAIANLSAINLKLTPHGQPRPIAVNSQSSLRGPMHSMREQFAVYP